MHRHGRGFWHGRRGHGEYPLLAVRMIEPALLVLLSEQELHGYTLLEKLEELGLVNIHPSVVYRILREMEEAGWVSSIWEREQTQGPPRRVYSLTDEGRAALRQWQDNLEQIKDLISRLQKRERR